MTLPLGIFSPPGEAPRVGARRGDRVLDLAAVGPAVLSAPSLNALMAAGPEAWAEVAALEDAPEFELADVGLRLPFEVADYVDFYSSLEHATNLGRLFRPDVIRCCRTGATCPSAITAGPAPWSRAGRRSCVRAARPSPRMPTLPASARAAASTSSSSSAP